MVTLSFTPLAVTFVLLFKTFSSFYAEKNTRSGQANSSASTRLRVDAAQPIVAATTA
ncbi:RNA helicase [Vibrio paracholerae]|uniref:RNA helicase n=1 Tax=Vibrio cholerae TaxID=666 RepID=A0A5C9SRN7_VIBCL|nr:RNA helicase [Vibrio cholerae]ORP19820.1 RNA helicase [Vibrio paracholerae]NAO56623.1 RNA helicase [Vibrio cholerae]RBM44999.1 RNA helicase [Vibrio paracholerae]RBM88409.1 RNA helicase [Vibrio paracholerae]